MATRKRKQTFADEVAGSLAQQLRAKLAAGFGPVRHRARTIKIAKHTGVHFHVSDEAIEITWAKTTRGQKIVTGDARFELNDLECFDKLSAQLAKLGIVVEFGAKAE